MGQESENHDVRKGELLRRLVEKEKCSRWMIVELTGIPFGSISGILKGLNIKTESAFNGGARDNINGLRRARKLALMRGKYGSRIAELFPQNPD